MTAPARRAAVTGAALVVLGLGCALRLYRLPEAPPGPWIDEALGLRAARIASSAHAPLVGSTPLQPPDAGFVNFWVTNPFLLGFSAIDRVAGGGIASVRAISAVPAFLLLLAAAALAAQVSAGRALPLLATCSLLSTSAWLLSTGRWGWLSVATSALVVLAALAALRAEHRSSAGWAAAAGALLGASGWGYPAAWALLALPLLVLVDSWRWRSADGGHRRRRALAATGLAAWALVTAPIAVHYAIHPERALARTRELSAGRDGGPALVPALGRNVVAYAKLFAVGGDPNERHGDPARPVLPIAVTALALVAAADGLRRGGPARLLAAAAGLLLAASLVAVEGSANAFRTSLVAPFVIVLAGLGAERLVELLGPARRRIVTAALVVVVAVSSLSDVAGFLRWLSSPRLYGAFGGPERDLADAVAAQLASAGPADVLLAPGAARNTFVVDALLQDPRSSAPAVRQCAGLGALRYVPSRDVLFADAATEEGAAPLRALGATPVASGGVLPGRPGWTLWRVPLARAQEAARAFLARFPLIPAAGSGFVVSEEGLYTFASRGAIEAKLDGGVVFGASRPAGLLTARLAKGKHELSVRPLVPGAALRVTGPDGFVLPPP